MKLKEGHTGPNVTTRQQIRNIKLSKSPDIAPIINRVRKAIYNALFYYWNDPAMAMLLATILDPRCKKTYGWPNELREKVKTELKIQYNELKPTIIQSNTQSQENPTITRPSIDCFQMNVFGPQETEDDEEDTEFDTYFNNIRTPQTSCDTNPFQWWRDNKKIFPVLFELARKYLCIPATSVPSERLFSDAGNQICEERNRLKASTVTELLFLKRNSEYFNIFE